MRPWELATTTWEWLNLNRGRSELASFAQKKMTLADLLDEQVRLRPNATMIVTAQGEISWAQFASLSNKIANILSANGVQKGEAVALNMENGILYLACVFGIARIGAVGGLINTNLRGLQLVHCVREIGANLSLVDASGLEAMSACRDAYLQASRSPRVIVFGCADKDALSEPLLDDGDLLLQQASADISPSALPILAGDRALYIFTSGTTGWPKPAIITHQKFVLGAAAHAIFSLRARAADRFYICLPLYHGTGLMVGVAACLYSGASIFIRPKFSASALVEEVNRYKCNVLIYVGEICRYLMNTPVNDSDRKCALERAAGNGLRPDIWKPFKRRFGLKRIGEFYGASEANGGFLNVFNKDETIGISGATVKLVRYVIEDVSIHRDQTGFAALVEPGEVGLLLFQVNEKDRFDGYTDQKQSEAKLERNVFEQGDCWFNSGDLLKQVDVGFAFNRAHYQFIDRLGDTFRWKSENVSTNEVAEVLCGFESVALAAVYGVQVPGADGKAGMAALVLHAGEAQLDCASFSAFVIAQLPHYARPLFVRLRAELETTGTHKMLKSTLIEEGFDINRVADELLCWDRQTSLYVRLDRARYEAILAARAGY